MTGRAVAANGRHHIPVSCVNLKTGLRSRFCQETTYKCLESSLVAKEDGENEREKARNPIPM